MAVFGLEPRIFRAQGRDGVLWGQSEFILDPMGWFYHVVWRRAALGTEYEGRVGALVHYNRSVADKNTLACLQYLFNMQPSAVLIGISGFRLRHMHYCKDIRANYPVRISAK
jgi:hypothetical protein